MTKSSKKRGGSWFSFGTTSTEQPKCEADAQTAFEAAKTKCAQDAADKAAADKAAAEAAAVTPAATGGKKQKKTHMGGKKSKKAKKSSKKSKKSKTAKKSKRC
jgi:hypothetical protein